MQARLKRLIHAGLIPEETKLHPLTPSNPGSVTEGQGR